MYNRPAPGKGKPGGGSSGGGALFSSSVALDVDAALPALVAQAAADRAAIRHLEQGAIGQVNAPATMQRVAARLIDLPRDDVRAFYRRRRDRVGGAAGLLPVDEPDDHRQ